ncbi:hypothetical protein B0H14DRAFT_3496050 [Mycena olivaceomarginata]|nr:hypothetical protein B0H14DRAFT_3496050 [Mycena olivaceomarginata]
MSLQPSALSGVEHAPPDLLSTRPDCAAHHPGTVDEPPSVSVYSLHMRARACADSPLLTPRRSRARASTPALHAPRLVGRVVRCIVQHEQALRLSIASPRTYIPTLRLALRAPPRCTPAPERT